MNRWPGNPNLSKRGTHRRLPGVLACLVAGCLATLPSPTAAQRPIPDVDQVMEYIDDLYRAQSSYSSMRMTVVRERGTRELELESWSKGDDDALIVIRSPAREAGTATLRTEDGLWNYAPRADRLIRIPTGLLSDAWMGSHFSNDDLMRETSYLDDYDAVMAWEERDGVTYLKATLTPKPDAPVVYSHMVFLITPDPWIPVRTEYYDDGELIRSMSFDQIRTIAGRPIPMRMILQPVDNEEERTVVEYLELELDIPVDDQLFTRQGLRRAARG